MLLDVTAANPQAFAISVLPLSQRSVSVQVVGDKQQTSRLLLCEATAVVMRQCFDLLGMTPMYQI